MQNPIPEENLLPPTKDSPNDKRVTTLGIVAAVAIITAIAVGGVIYVRQKAVLNQTTSAIDIMQGQIDTMLDRELEMMEGEKMDKSKIPEGWTRMTVAGTTFIYPLKTADDRNIIVNVMGGKITLYPEDQPTFTHSIKIEDIYPGELLTYMPPNLPENKEFRDNCELKEYDGGWTTPGGYKMTTYEWVDNSNPEIRILSVCPFQGSIGFTFKPNSSTKLFTVGLGQDSFLKDTMTFVKSIEPSK